MCVHLHTGMQTEDAWSFYATLAGRRIRLHILSQIYVSCVVLDKVNEILHS